MNKLPYILIDFRLQEKHPSGDHAAKLNELGVPNHLVEELYEVHQNASRNLTRVELAINYSIIPQLEAWVVARLVKQRASGHSLAMWRSFIRRIKTLEEELEVPEQHAARLTKLLDEWALVNRR